VPAARSAEVPPESKPKKVPARASAEKQAEAVVEAVDDGRDRAKLPELRKAALERKRQRMAARA